MNQAELGTLLSGEVPQATWLSVLLKRRGRRQNDRADAEASARPFYFMFRPSGRDVHDFSFRELLFSVSAGGRRER
ncbi:hypothetical protein [Caproicibacter fermentans]|uniref:hypothetical protein n=1 Tax=Caproicibacter fermentans TaxID=2576756 RepID=UPI0012ECE372|nr:hypothetical protein [Caproicibacter fermentans]